MPLNTANSLIFGGDDAMVYMAPVGTAFPTGLAAPAATWADLGWLSEEGVTLGAEPEQKDFYGHQGGALVASVILREDRTIKFQCLESTAKQLGLYWSGLTLTTTGTGPAAVHAGEIKGARSVPRAFIYDDYAINATLADGTTPIRERYMISKGVVSEKAELVMQRGEIRIFDFTVKVLGGFTFATNNPAMAPA